MVSGSGICTTEETSIVYGVGVLDMLFLWARECGLLVSIVKDRLPRSLLIGIEGFC